MGQPAVHPLQLHVDVGCGLAGGEAG